MARCKLVAIRWKRVLTFIQLRLFLRIQILEHFENVSWLRMKTVRYDLLNFFSSREVNLRIVSILRCLYAKAHPFPFYDALTKKSIFSSTVSIFLWAFRFRTLLNLFGSSFRDIFSGLSVYCAIYTLKKGNEEFIIMHRLYSQKHVSLLCEHGLECFLKPPKSIIASFLQPTPTFPLGVSFYCSIFSPSKKLKMMRKTKVESEEWEKNQQKTKFKLSNFCCIYVNGSYNYTFLFLFKNIEIRTPRVKNEKGRRISGAEKCG